LFNVVYLLFRSITGDPETNLAGVFAATPVSGTQHVRRDCQVDFWRKSPIQCVACMSTNDRQQNVIHYVRHFAVWKTSIKMFLAADAL